MLMSLIAAAQEKKNGLLDARTQIRERILTKETEIDKIALERAQRTLDFAVQFSFCGRDERDAN